MTKGLRVNTRKSVRKRLTKIPPEEADKLTNKSLRRWATDCRAHHRPNLGKGIPGNYNIAVEDAEKKIKKEKS